MIEKIVYKRLVLKHFNKMMRLNACKRIGIKSSNGYNYVCFLNNEHPCCFQAGNKRIKCHHIIYLSDQNIIDWLEETNVPTIRYCTCTEAREKFDSEHLDNDYISDYKLAIASKEELVLKDHKEFDDYSEEEIEMLF